MESSRKYYNLAANSIIESVISLCIISVCLYVAVLVFAAVFSPRTSAGFFNRQHQVNELFFLLQLKKDSLLNENGNEQLKFDEESISESVSRISIRYNDSTKFQTEQSFYIRNEE